MKRGKEDEKIIKFGAYVRAFFTEEHGAYAEMPRM